MITENDTKYAPDGTAWKTKGMKGYVYKTALDPDKYGEGAYMLTFRKAEDQSHQPVDAWFYFDVDRTASQEAAAAADCTDLNLSGELLKHLMNGNWVTGKKEEYEEARTGGGEW